MTLSQLHQTVFNVEPMQNIVGVGDITAYQIVINSGPALGKIGSVSVPAQAEICNDPDFDRNSAIATGIDRMGTWVRRVLAIHGF